MKTVMLHMKLPEDLAEACEGKDLKAEVSAALRDRWFHPLKTYGEIREEILDHASAVPLLTYGSIPAEQKREYMSDEFYAQPEGS